MKHGLVIALALVAVTAPADASRKPCRGADGKLVPCPKPTPAPSPRCKDARGRFAPCAPATRDKR